MGASGPFACLFREKSAKNAPTKHEWLQANREPPPTQLWASYNDPASYHELQWHTNPSAPAVRRSYAPSHDMYTTKYNAQHPESMQVGPKIKMPAVPQ